MKKRRLPYIIGVIVIVCCMLNISACGKEVVAENPTPTEPVAVVEPTVEPIPTEEPEPTEEVVEVPTPIPTEEPEEILPTPEIDIDDYINDNYGFDFVHYAKDLGYTKDHPVSCDLEKLSIISFRVNGWVVSLWGDPWHQTDGYISTAKAVEGDTYNNEMVVEWCIPYKMSEEDIVVVKLRDISAEYSLESIKTLPYVIEWYKENPYREGPPDVFKDQWEAW